jgi:hypothetical protein
MKGILLTTAALFTFAAAPADDKKPDDKKPDARSDFPIALTIVVKTDKHKFDGGGKTPAEYKKSLEAWAKQEVKKFVSPTPPAVDLVLVLTNTSKGDVKIGVDGDENVYTLDLTGGDGVVRLSSGLPVTTDLRVPKTITLAPGKTHEIPIKRLSDGFRGISENIYWTGPGEYKLSATYTVIEEGGKERRLKSEAVKIMVTEK